jgi:exonuclease VII small subunit
VSKVAGDSDIAGQVPVSDLSYSAASRELDTIVEFFEQRDVDIDLLVARLERATAIVDELDRRIRRTRAQVEELVPKLEEISQRSKIDVSGDQIASGGGGADENQGSDRDDQSMF